MRTPDVIDRYFTAVNDEDWISMAELWSEDGVLQATGARTSHGRRAVLAYFPKVLAGFAEHQDVPVRRITQGQTVVVEIAFAGRRDDGRRVNFDAVDVFDLRDGWIVRLSSWYDTAAVGRMITGGQALGANSGNTEGDT